MKIRSGFVSNSSSTSYMVIGVRLTDEDISLLYNKLKEEGEDEIECIQRIQGRFKIEDICDKPDSDYFGGYVVGWGVAVSSDGGYLDVSEDLVMDVNLKVSESLMIMNEYIPEISSRPMKIFTGTGGS